MTAAAPPGAGAAPTGGGAPPVVAVMVTRNAGPFLEDALASLEGQDYPALTILVVDAGSRVDPTPRISASAPSAFVRRLDGQPGFPTSVNEVLAAADRAAFLLVCHDDVVLDPGAVRVMVGEAYRSNAAIVGPKIVDADDPRVLLEVGRAIDRFGGSHTGLEPGELDQEQHDGVRDVFYVSSATMLVRADLFRELEGFDPASFPGSEDLDLCWRARLAGARVMVAPDARVLHHEAAAARRAEDVPSVGAVARARVRVLLTCYSRASLAFVVPLGLAISLLEAIVLLPTGRRQEAFAAFRAWWWNVARFGRIRRARRVAQARRAIHDTDLRELQVGAGARVSAFLAHRHADERLQSVGERGRDLLEAFGDAMRTPAAYALLAAIAVLALGSRDLFSDGVPAVGDVVPWPGVEALVAEFTSVWRHTGLGSTAQAPPSLALMAGLGALFFGSVGFAQALVVAGAFVLGGVGAYRLARAISAGPAAAAAAALAYVFVPVPRNAIATGRFGPLVLYATLPFLAVLLTRVGGFAGVRGSARRPLVGLALATAFAASFGPLALAAPVAVALAWLAASVLVGDGVAALRSLGAAIVGALGAALLLAPWVATLLGATDDLAALGIRFHPDLGLAEVLRFETGPAGAGVAPWGLLLAATLALVLARGAMFAWAVRAWVLVVVGVAAVWLPARLAPDTAVLAPEAGLSLAALGVALAAAIAVGAVPIGRRVPDGGVDDGTFPEDVEELPEWAGATTRPLGPRARGSRADAGRRALVVLAVVGVVFGGFGFLGDAADGRWNAPEEDWVEVLAFTGDQIEQGGFRVLWIGDPAIVPFDPVDRGHGFGWVLTSDGPGDARDALRGPVTDADEFVERSLVRATSGDTARLGRLLAVAGVRYVAFPQRDGVGGTRAPRLPAVTAALADQLDLARLRSEPGLVLYENESWSPVPSVVTGEVADTIPVGPPGDDPPASAAAASDLADAEPLGPGTVPAGRILHGQAYDPGWQATGEDGTLDHAEAFGVVNTWSVPAAQRVRIGHDGQTTRTLVGVLQVVVWLAALVWWGFGRRGARSVRAARRRRERRERAEQRTDPIALLDADDDSFWGA